MQHLFSFMLFSPYMFMDNSFIVYVLPALVLSLIAQWNVKSTFNRYSNVFCSRGYTGAYVARRILDQNGLYKVRVERVSGRLSDHYDPKPRVVRLSQQVYDGRSVASIGVAAHETGHAIQHSVSYAPLTFRNAIIPVTQFSSSVSIWIILAGLILSWSPLLLAGIVLFSFAVLFQIITLPIEFNASARALKILDESSILFGDELTGAKKVLRAAALTYVAATILAFAQLLRLLSLYGGSRRRN
jgi:Zn-dependent membrane protease YugP